jgi:prefoldin alpha subunit
MERQEQLRRILVEMRMMEGSVNTLQQRLELLTSAISELRLAQNSLKDLQDIDKGNPMLVPIGGGAFVNAELGDLSNVIVGIGADVSVEMKYENAVEDITERLEEMEKAHTAVQQQLGQILAQLESHQQVAERLSAEIQGDSPGV